MPPQLLALLTAHPDVLQAFLNAEVEAAKDDPKFLPDLLVAVSSGSYASFALHHLGFVLKMGSLIAANPALIAALKDLTKTP